jgi:PAS domain S-box-containing protein
MSLTVSHNIHRSGFLLFLVTCMLSISLNLSPQNPETKKIYRVGIPDSPGIMYHNPSGKVSGFPAEVLESAAHDEGLVIEWVDGRWNDLYQMLENGEIDALPGTQVSEERRQKLDFLSVPLFTTWCELFILKGTDFKDLNQLNGKSIGLMENDNNAIAFENYFKGFYLDYKPVFFRSFNEAVLAMQSGMVYALAGPTPYLLNPNWGQLKSTGLVYNPTTISIAFAKGKNNEFRDAIDRRIIEQRKDPNSTFNQLNEKYLVKEPDNMESRVSNWLIYALIFMSLTSICIVVFIIILKRRVLRKTEEIRHRQQNLIATLNSIGDGVITTDQMGNITNMSQVAQKMTNWPLVLALNNQAHEVFSFVDPKASVKVLYPVIEVLKKKETVILPSRMMLVSKYSKERYHITGSASPILDHTGELLGVIVVFQDITELYQNRESLRENELYLRKVLELGEMGTWSYQIKNNTYQWSLELFKMLGYDIQVNVTSVFIDAIIHPDDLARVNAVMKLGIEKKENYESKFRIQTAYGKYLHVKSIGLMILDDNQKADHIIGIIQNITSQEQYEQELIKAKEKAEESERLKTAFLANMSHEIRTPLNAIIGFSELLTQANMTPEKRKYFSRLVIDQNNLLLNLINDIIDISRIESGSFELNIQPHINILSLIDEVYAGFAHQCPTGIKFIKGANDYHGECQLDIDPIRVKQILNNFVINAFKYTRQGIVELGFRLNFANNAIEIYVRDTGIGIDKALQEKIFERFSQIDQMAQGAGLGLAICKSLAKLMDGEITLISEPGTGSEFALRLPVPALANVVLNEDNQQISNTEDEDLNNLDLSKFKVLIAEDMDSNYLLLENLLLPKGAVISRAINGAEALAKVKNEKIDLILMDIKMPVMDGLEATRQIREINPTLPVIAVTAYAFDTDRYKAIEMGCSDYISKPIDSEELMETISRVIHLKP